MVSTLSGTLRRVSNQTQPLHKCQIWRIHYIEDSDSRLGTIIEVNEDVILGDVVEEDDEFIPLQKVKIWR